MLSRRHRIRTQISQLVDAALFAVSFWLAYRLRSDPDIVGSLHLDKVKPLGDYLPVFLLLVLSAPVLLETQGFYNRPLLPPRRLTLWLLLRGCWLAALAVVVVGFALRTPIARWMVFWFAGLSFLLVWAKEELVGLALRSRVAQAQFRRRFILVGTREELARMRADTARVHREIDVIAYLDLDDTPVSRLVDLLHEFGVNGVIISARRTYFEAVEAVIRACELEGVEVWLMAEFFKTQISRTSLDDWHGKPMLVFRSTPEVSWQREIKKVLDVALSALALLVLAVPMALLALAVRLSSPGPAFFRQQRAGLNGHPFTMYKFRTMVTNAEQLKQELAALNEMSGPVFKVTNDPRITPIGRFLRKFSLDELPQLLNVLRGEMSLVGPRPLPVEEVARFDDVAHRRRLSVKPGLTCLWQISGRNQVTDFKDWVRLDLDYIDHWSLRLDVTILLRTIPVVLMGTGAK